MHPIVLAMYICFGVGILLFATGWIIDDKYVSYKHPGKLGPTASALMVFGVIGLIAGVILFACSLWNDKVNTDNQERYLLYNVLEAKYNINVYKTHIHYNQVWFTYNDSPEVACEGLYSIMGREIMLGDVFCGVEK